MLVSATLASAGEPK